MQLQLMSESLVDVDKNSFDNGFREGSLQCNADLFLQREKYYIFGDSMSSSSLSVVCSNMLHVSMDSFQIKL